MITNAARDLSAQQELQPADEKCFTDLLAFKELVEYGLERATTYAKLNGDPKRQGDAQPGTLWALKRDQSVAEYVGHGNGELQGISFGDAIRARVFGVGADAARIRGALTEGSDASGGFLVPDELSARLIDKLRARSVVVRAGAQTVPLSSDNLRVARVASDPTPGWRNEAAAVAEADPTFDSVQFTPRSLALIIKASRELAQDAPNFSEAIENVIAGAFATEVDRVALVGSGTAPQPRGVFNTSGIQSISMGTNGAALTSWSPVLDAIRDLELANAGDVSAMVMSPRTSRTLNGFVATDNQPLQPPPRIADVPRLVTTGVPVNQTQGTSNNASTILIGDFAQVWLGVRQQLTIVPLPTLFAQTLQIGFVAFLRVDVQIAHPEALARIIGITP